MDKVGTKWNLKPIYLYELTQFKEYLLYVSDL